MLINGKRALAYIQEIGKVQPIEGADNIELVSILGWHCISKIGEFKEGDKCIYFEIDSKLPTSDKRFEFMAKKDYKVKTYKLNKFKVIGQGLALPLDEFPELVGLDVNTDVTDKLHITYAELEDNSRKAPEGAWVSLQSRKPKLFKHPIVKWLSKRKWGRKLVLAIWGSKRDGKSFPSKYCSKTDEERCLVGTTKVLTDQGSIILSTIVNKQLDVKVATMNEDGTISYNKILKYQKIKNDKQMITIGYSYKTDTARLTHLCCTTDHPILTQRGYVLAQDLTTNDYIYKPDFCFEESSLGAIYGMLLGDSHIANDKRTKGRLRICATNGQAQLEYLQYKQQIFDGIGNIINAGRSGFNTENFIYRWIMPVDSYFSQNVRKDFLAEDGHKIVTPAVLSKLNNVGLALWYMDDGNLSYRDDDRYRPKIRINTQGFTYEENVLLAEYLNQKGYECKVIKEEREGKSIYYHIYITVEGTPKFLEDITPYMCKSMAYKTLPRFEYLLETKTPRYKQIERVLPSPIVSIEEGQKKNKSLTSVPTYVFDLTVENNHNFIADGIVVHNCQNTPYLLTDKSPYVVTEKLDGTSSTYVLVRHRHWYGTKYEFIVSSRNVRQANEDQQCFHEYNIYWAMAKKYDLENKMKQMLSKLPEANFLVLQGESIGKVQGNPYKLQEDDIYFFNLIDGKHGKWDTESAAEFANSFGLKWVPIISTDYVLPDTVDELLEAATGPSVVNPKVLREGWVIRRADGNDNIISFKAVSPTYLLKHNL